MAFTRPRSHRTAKVRAIEGLEPEARSLESAYTFALRALSRRELSESQIRQRLARRGYDPDAIEDAVGRLKANRSLDDARAAAAIARTETGLKKRGRVRVRMQIQRAGIGSELAKRAVDDAFGDIDDDTLIESALRKRLREGQRIDDDRSFQRLYRYLVGQGFESDKVLKLLSRRRKRSAAEDVEEG